MGMMCSPAGKGPGGWLGLFEDIVLECLAGLLLCFLSWSCVVKCVYVRSEPGLFVLDQ
jgi:hypothetical protein